VADLPAGAHEGWDGGPVRGLSPPAWSLDVSNACRCVFRAFIAHFIAPFIVREAMVDQPELKPRSIDAIRSSSAIARAFCSASSLSVRVQSSTETP
jgi:hypothetical protein